ncbi:MAG: hypothetical protein FJ265_05570 [Planctomycetes bacterium]|nr:hypothetical protein [Planctomycetota bacterium]
MHHRPHLIASLVALGALGALPAQGRDARSRRPAAPVELRHFTHELRTFRSEAVGKEVPYGVYLPRDYGADASKETTWPLVIWLHGMWEDHDRFHSRGGAPLLDKAVEDGLLPPCIFVLANGGRTSMYIDAGPQRNHQALVQKDLLAHLAATFRVRQERNQRALMGISMGGMAALRIGFTHPQLFGTVAVHSSALFPPDPKQLPDRLLQRAKDFGLDEVFGSPIDESLWRATNPLGIAEALEPKTLDGLRLYFDAGTADRYQFGRTNEQLHALLESKKVPHRFELVQGGGHAWGSGFKDESLLASLRFVGDGFRAAAAAGAALQGLGGAAGDGRVGKEAPAPQAPPGPGR